MITLTYNLQDYANGALSFSKQLELQQRPICEIRKQVLPSSVFLRFKEATALNRADIFCYSKGLIGELGQIGDILSKKGLPYEYQFSSDPELADMDKVVFTVFVEDDTQDILALKVSFLKELSRIIPWGKRQFFIFLFENGTY